ncbi:LysE family translocator [Vannielia litorea]|uniref:LysE family translocator n=1 Tax=Vannielia litorea TaxID=1217970 RepID=UPI001BCB8665|nr:LysE family translocator [Vannielia litorea]MBS8228390.1 LysE family translocator [Vannielia litorea]
MIDALTLLAFLPAALALNLTPGADMMFVLAQSLKGGRAPAMAANLGIAAGCIVNVAAAGLGLGALISALPGAFEVIRWAGVAYLLWLAVATLRSGGPGRSKAPPLTPARAFRQALLVNVTNPKVILFILAFLPQFVDPARAVLPQFLALGTVLAMGGLLINGAVGLGAGSLGLALTRSPRLTRALSWITAGIFGALAARLALMDRT